MYIYIYRKLNVYVYLYGKELIKKLKCLYMYVFLKKKKRNSTEF